MWRARIGTTSSHLLAVLALISAMICTDVAAGGASPAGGVPRGAIPMEALQALVDQTVSRGIPGVVLGIATSEGSWYVSSGVASVETGEPMSPLHALRLANASETFIAALVWSLVEEGRLSPADKVNRRLPSGLVPRGDEITIGMLLNHTSGLYDHTESDEYGKVMAKSPDHAWKAAEVLAITRAHPFRFNPGTGYAYCSTEAYILGLIVEAATGRTVENLALKRFFTPLNMAQTTFSRSGRLPVLSTPGYVWLDGQSQPVSTGQWSFSGQWTSGSAVSNAHDMLVWAKGLASGKVLKPKTLQSALTVSSPSMTGYGFEVTRNPSGLERMGRMGVKPGTGTDLLLYPDEGRALFIGLNISDARLAPTLPTRRIIRDVRDGVERLLGWSVETDYSETIAYGRAALADMLDRACSASAMVGLVDGDRIVWSETFVNNHLTGKIAPTTETMYAIGSTSKLFAAMAVMKLVDQGKIDLDTPLVNYLPEFHMVSPHYSKVTVRMLLNHSAGFPGGDYRGDSTYAPRPDFAAQVQETLSTQRLKYEPGRMATYCNDCFTMIEPLVEAVAEGKSYDQFLEDEILTPVGMTRTRFGLEPFPAGSYASYYPCPGDPPALADVPEPQIYTNTQGAGGLYSTPIDMGRLAMMLMNGGRYGEYQVLSEKAVAEIGRDQTRCLPVNPVPTENYGLGLDWVAYPGLAAAGVRAWAKPGGAAGYATQFILAPDDGLGVIVTGVSVVFDSGTLAEQILLHALAERGSIHGVPQSMPKMKQPEKSPTDAVLAAMVGDYAENYKLHRVEAMSDRTLTITTYLGMGGEMKPLLPAAAGLKWRSDGTFSSDDDQNVSYRVLNAGGRHYLAMNQPYGHYRMESIIGQRIQEKDPLSATWQQRVNARWLVVNEDPESVWLARGTPRFTLYALDTLPGYVFAVGQPMLAPSDIVDPSASDVLGRMFLKIPLAAGRDLNDLVIEARDGEEWVLYGSALYRPQATVPVLPAGGGSVAIGTEGFAEWRQVPIGGTVAIEGATAWKLYDPDLQLKLSGTGSGSVEVEKPGSYLMLYGPPNGSIALTTVSSEQ